MDKIDSYIKEYYYLKKNTEIINDLGISYREFTKRCKQMSLSKRVKFTLHKNEELKDIPNFNKYKASSYGRIVKLKDNTEIIPSATSDGYLSVKLINDNGQRTNIRLNRLIAFVFHNPYNKEFLYFRGLEANHIDGDIKNNKASNLEWLTPSENQKHAYANNLRKPISRDKCKLTSHTEKQVRETCELISKGYSLSEIKSLLSFNATDGFINALKRKKTWKDIVTEYDFSNNDMV